MYRKLGATKGARYVQGITYGGRRDACGVLVGKPEGKKTLGRHRRRWENNIKMDFQEVGWGAWTGLIWLKIGTGSGKL